MRAIGTGGMVVLPGAGQVTNDMLAQPMTSGTAQASTSGTSIDFTGIPSWVKRITISLAGVSTSSGSSNTLALRIGDSGGIETTGYAGGTGFFGASMNGTTSTTAFLLAYNIAGANTVHGVIHLTLVNASSNLWAFSFAGAVSDAAYGFASGGSKALSATLDRVQLFFTAGGSFDGGTINIIYE